MDFVKTEDQNNVEEENYDVYMNNHSIKVYKHVEVSFGDPSARCRRDGDGHHRGHAPKGWVTMAGLDGNSPILCSRQVTLVPDKSLADALAENPQYDAIILPGGLEGSDRLSKSSVVGTVLKEHEKAGKIIAAICAAPTAFAAHGVAQGKRVTSYPSTKSKMEEAGGYKYVEGERVVVDGNVVTSRGPGTAYWFGLQLVELLTGKEKADQVENGMLISKYLL